MSLYGHSVIKTPSSSAALLQYSFLHSNKYEQLLWYLDSLRPRGHRLSKLRIRNAEFLENFRSKIFIDFKTKFQDSSFGLKWVRLDRVQVCERVFSVWYAVVMITQVDVIGVIQFSFKSVSVLYSDYQIR